MEKSKKVLFVATVTSHIKGFHEPYLQLLQKSGYKTYVAASNNLFKNEKINYCDEFIEIPIERSPFKLKNIKAIRELKKLIEKEKFDIIHCHTPMGSVVARLAAKNARKKYGTRVIYTAHGFHFYKSAPKLNWFLFYPVEKYLAKYTDTLITINHEDYKLANKKFSRRCHDIKYVPGVGIDTKKFDIKLSDKEIGELKKSLKLSENDYVLTCVARLDANKNQGFLINVMNQLVKNNPSIHLLLVGPDELNGYYQKVVNDMDLNHNIHFLGERRDIPQLLYITDIVVSASKREGLPVNVIEAFAAGKPVVALNCRGMSDLIIDGRNGFVVNNNNTSKFSEKINTIFDDDKLKKAISTNSILDSNKFRLEFVKNSYKDIYKI